MSMFFVAPTYIGKKPKYFFFQKIFWVSLDWGIYMKIL